MIRAAALLAAAALALPVHAQRPLDDPAHWLGRIAGARTLHYHGEVVFRHGDRVEAMEVVRRGGPDGYSERLLMLDGVPREVLRDGHSVTCILPEGRESLAGLRVPRNPFPAGDWAHTDAVAAHYDFFDLGDARVAGRTCKVIGIQPRDAFRYGYRLWVDVDTGLLLRSDVVDADGSVVEQAAFTRVRVPAEIDDRHLEPTLDGETLRWPVKRGGRARTAVPEWRVGAVPSGFAEKRAAGDTTSPPRQFTDGLATVSVFVSPVRPDRPGLAGTSRMGAVSAFGTVVDGYQVTVVGEVPTLTVQTIAESLSLDAAR